MQRVFPVAAALVLFACGTTFAQSPTTRSTALMADQSDNPTDGAWGLTNPDAFRWCRRWRTRRHSTQFGKPDPPARRRPGQHHNMSNDRYGKLDNRHQRWRLAGDDDRHVGDRSVRDVSAGRPCSPSTPTIAPGFSNAAPPPSPGTITGSAFSDGALPLDVTEAGGAGLSPIIAVPDPATSATSCNGGSTMMATPSLPTLFDNAGATSISSPYGC